MKFFFDRNLSVHLARMLSHFDRENNIVHQDDDNRFSEDSEDEHIIRTLAFDCPKPVWVTNDISQRRIPAERIALRDSEMTIFFFKRNNGSIHHQALKVLSIWPTITSAASRVKAPTAFEIPSGRIGKLSEKIDRLGHTNELFKNT